MKAEIVKSLRTERWTIGTRSGWFNPFKPCLVHPRCSGLKVTRLGSVFLHGMRVSWPHCCIARAVRHQLLSHLRCDLTGQPENNR